MTEQRCAVVGHPVEHSLSPAIHRAAYARLGLDWSYQCIDVAPDGLPAFVAGLDGSWRGLSVTMPHKGDAARIGIGDDIVRLTEVANTLVFVGGDVLSRNTDVTGYRIALAAHEVGDLERVLVVGNGATARSAVAAVATLGARAVTVACRIPERGQGVGFLGAEMGLETEIIALGAQPERHDLVISTIPAAGVAEHAEVIAGCAPVIFDSVYDPWPTPLGQASARQGRTVLNGLDLLAGQAVDQVRWFTGSPVDFALARTTAQDALNR